ncbi:RNA polymerase II mediator complex subunit [Paramarasmius palmivorus]|uniref:RNA polymerase II mediator complex subunit n=1 Tax=Paramarasmius palmivorus TaxID=297713 RepID=A0AAW0BLJ0_9AGAR
MFPEILMLINDTAAASMLADGLWIRYRLSLDWAYYEFVGTTSTEPHFPLPITNIPVLDISEDLGQPAKVIRQRLCEADPFRQGVYRNLSIVREAFKRTLQLTEETTEELSKQTVAASRMAFGKGTEGKIQLRCADDNGSEISGKSINDGLRRVTDVISKMSFGLDALRDSLGRTEELHRVLNYVTEPLRDNPSGLPVISSDIQDVLIPVLSTKLEVLLDPIQGDSSDHDFHTAGDHPDRIAYPLLLETLYYLLDEIANDAKLGAGDPFHFYPDTSLSALPLDLPPEYHLQLKSLISELPTPQSIADL